MRFDLVDAATSAPLAASAFTAGIRGRGPEGVMTVRADGTATFAALVGRAAPGRASLRQMMWVAASGDAVAQLDPRTCATAIMAAEIALVAPSYSSVEWEYASDQITARIADGHIALGDLERVNV